MAYKDPEKGRVRDWERLRQRTAERRAQGLCPRCGKEPPVPDRSLCEPCGKKRRKAERARDAKRKTAGKTRYKDPEKARACGRRRYKQLTAERLARGLCPKCGKAPLAPDRSLCEPCGKKRRKAERRRQALRRPGPGGLPQDRAQKEQAAPAGTPRRRPVYALRQPSPVEGGTTCGPCRDARHEAEREQYAVRRAAGLCGRCGGPAFDGAPRCGPCAAIEAGRHPRKNAASHKRYARRRARWLCTDCGQPSQGAARCVPCARRSYVRSGQHRGLPIWPPSYTVIEIATGEDHGTWDSEAEVAMCLAFAKISRTKWR